MHSFEFKKNPVELYTQVVCTVQTQVQVGEEN